MKTVTLFFICLLFGLLPLQAQTQASWTKLYSLPEGASVIDLAVDNNNTVYALTYFMDEIYYTTDNGLTWTLIPGNNIYSNVTDIEVDRSTNTLYVGTISRGLHWTTNKGASWQNVPFYTVPSSGTNAFINKTVRKPGSNIIVCNEPGMFANSAMYRSTNAGNSWTNFLVNFGGVYDFKYLSNGTLFAGTENGIYESTDDGLTWDSLNTGISKMKISSILEKHGGSKLFVASDFNSNTFDSTGTGVFVSTNGGSNWVKCTTGMTDCRITCLAQDSTSGNIYASYYGGVYVSSNDGQTWTSVNTGLGQNDYACIAANVNGLFAGGRKSGASFSSQPASGWLVRNTGLKVSTISNMRMTGNADIHVQDRSNTGVYHLNAGSWTQQNNGLPSSSGQKLAKAPNGVLYASYISDTVCLYRSLNQGATWMPVTSLPMPPNIFWGTCSAIKTDAYNNVYVVLEVSSSIGYQPPQLFRSQDNGLTWTLLYTMDPTTYISLNDVDLASDSTIYISLRTMSVQNEFLYSSDFGATFSVTAYTVNQMGSLADLVVAPNDSLYVMQDNLLYKRSGIGNWTALAGNPWTQDPNPTIQLYFDNALNLYVTDRNQGIKFSADDGVTWSDMSNGLPSFTPPFSPSMTIHIYDLQFDNNNVPYAISTDNGSGNLMGIYRYAVPQNTTSTVGIKNVAENSSFVLVYPNPVTNICTVAYSVKDQAHASLLLYNASGAVVKTIDSLPAGNDRVDVDMTELPCGIYFLKMNADGKTPVTKLMKQ